MSSTYEHVVLVTTTRLRRADVDVFSSKDMLQLKQHNNGIIAEASDAVLEDKDLVSRRLGSWYWDEIFFEF